MPTRKRAYRGQEIVTVIDGKIGSKKLVTIRNSRGFEERVRGKLLEAIPKDDSRGTLKFGNSEDFE